jgi:predicted permease
MGRSPGLTAVALLSLALGIGANTAIFSFVEALILKALPVQHPEALVSFGPGLASGNSGGFPDDDTWLFSYPIYREMQQKNQVFSGVAAFNSFEDNLHGTVGSGSGLERMDVQLVSGTYFNLLGVTPFLGRVLTDTDDLTPGGHPLAVVSYKWWTGRFSRDPSIVGKTLTIGGTVYTVIGVTQPAFFGITVGEAPDLWIPLQMHDQINKGPHKISDKFYRSLDIIARLKPGVSLAQAGANVNLVFKDILRGYAGPQPTQEHLEDIRKAHIQVLSAANGISFLRDQFQKPLWMLMAIVGLVLLIACANIANLLLARGTSRQRELAVRMALGAGRRRLIGQLFTESLVLAVLGCGLGMLFAAWASRFLLRIVSGGPKIIPLDISPDVRVLAFTAAVSLATAVLFGMLPALRSTRVELTPSLKEGRGAMPTHARSPLGKVLIISQVGLSLVLLMGAGLFFRSLVNLVHVDTGFNRQGVLLINLDPTATGYTDEPRLASLYREVEERVAAVPGVRAASFAQWTYAQGGWNDGAWPEGSAAKPGFDNQSWFDPVGPDYFATMGLPILVGRGFGPQDTSSSPRAAVINETMARKFFPGGPAVGKRFGMEGPEHSHDIEVIGVVRDAKYQDLDEKPRPMAYYCYTQYIPAWGVGLYLPQLAIRYSGNTQAAISGIRRAVTEINASLPVGSVRTLSEQVDNSILFPRLVAQLSTFFAALAVFLACLGIFGLMSYAVGCRTNEIGVRMALGARQVDVLRMVMRETVVMVVAGLAIGVLVALASGPWAASLLYGLQARDPLTLLAAVALLLAVAAFAGYLPARRASRVDPMVALRYE